MDPFSGRGTTLLESLLLGREALAIDTNPVAVCVTAAKAMAPGLDAVLSRIEELEHEFIYAQMNDLDMQRFDLPPFFKYAFHANTLRETIFLRNSLDWRQDSIDRFVAALVLGSLHGEMDRSPSYFSNQMPRTISTKPMYSIKYWRKHKLKAQRREAFSILKQRAGFRLAIAGPPTPGTVMFGDARNAHSALRKHHGRVNCIVTSPPYLNITNFEEDQWLRLWFLGGPPFPTYGRVSKDDRHCSERTYWKFLAEAWQGISELLTRSATIVCRIGGKNQNIDSLGWGLAKSLRAAFPKSKLVYGPLVSAPLRRQTDNFRPGTAGCRLEADFVFQTS